MLRDVLDCATYGCRDDGNTADVIVILNVARSAAVEPAVQSLKDAGMQIVAIDCEDGVIEGYLDSEKIESLRHLPGVDYVRPLFNFDSDAAGC